MKTPFCETLYCFVCVRSSKGKRRKNGLPITTQLTLHSKTVQDYRRDGLVCTFITVVTSLKTIPSLQMCNGERKNSYCYYIVMHKIGHQKKRGILLFYLISRTPFLLSKMKYQFRSVFAFLQITFEQVHYYY